MIAAAPNSLSSADPVALSQDQHGGKAMKFLAKSNVDFRQASRKEDSRKLQMAFSGHTQDAIAQKAARALDVSPRQIIYWMKCENDMPSWAVKAVEHYLRRVETIAIRIEGQR